MFAETLLESSTTLHRPRRWPVAVAFTLQAAGICVMLLLPLLTPGLLPLSAKTPIVVPVFSQAKPEHVRHDQPNTSGISTGPAVVANTGGHRINLSTIGDLRMDGPADFRWTTGPSGFPPSLAGPGNGPTIILETPVIRRPLHVSHMDEGMLVNKVIPTYPLVAIRAGIQGEVTLHAIIGRDGSIESLSVIKGHPLLINAARDAVRQWMYRPYILNGEPIEVETYIVVNFKKVL